MEERRDNDKRRDTSRTFIGMTAEPEEPLGWHEAQSALARWHQTEGSRHTDSVEFVFNLTEDIYDPAGPYGHLEEAEAARVAAEVESARLVDELGLRTEFPEVTFQGRGEAVGRGAAGDAFALALRIATEVAEDVLTWVGAAGVVGAIWRRLRRTKEQPPPVLSLGAIKHLCLADLNERLGGHVEGIKLMYAGDVGPSQNVDLGFTGEDLFIVIFASAQKTWRYLVDDQGRLVQCGEGGPSHTFSRGGLGSWTSVRIAKTLPSFSTTRTTRVRSDSRALVEERLSRRGRAAPQPLR